MRINPGEPKQVEKPSIKKIIYELLLTLNSRARPYTEIRIWKGTFSAFPLALKRIQPALLAYEMGFPTFEAFIKCDEMSKYVSIRLDDDVDKRRSTYLIRTQD
uniref:DUF7515 domain-containing protein n=1 Tax=Ditylenchus dipsaci TaxID=166011 RepID=A0A915EHZ7_9BILA